MIISVLYFAGARDAVGVAEEQLELPSEGISIQRLAILLLKRHPRLNLEGVRFAINEEFANSETLVHAGDLVAVIPPVSGG